MKSLDILVQCKKCGLFATSEEQLSNFVKSKSCKYGVRPLCLACSYKILIEDRKKKELKILNQKKYLRKCNTCGLEANNERHLTLFLENNDSPFGRRNTCKVCNYIKKRKPLYEDLRLHLRKCNVCGLEAKKNSDLGFFIKDDKCNYGRQNKCKGCFNHESRDLYFHNPLVREKNKKISFSYRTRNKDAIAKKKKKYYLDNLDKIREKQASPEYLAKARHTSSKRRNIKLKARPKWLSQDEIDKIKNLYFQASYLTTITGNVWVVDHIYPLQGTTSCGLDIFNNLQLLEDSINSSKSNNLGYLWQKVDYDFYSKLPKRVSDEELFNSMGLNTAWEDFKYIYKEDNNEKRES